MSSSSSDDYRMYRRLFPVHDAVELGDLEGLTRMLRPRKVDAGLTTPVIAGEGAIGNSNSNSIIKDGDAEDHDQDAPDRDDGDYGFHVHVDLEERDAEGATPLHVALLHRRLDAVRLLLEAGAGTTKRLEGSTPAHIALSVASVRRHRAFGNAALKLLLENHHDVTVKDDRGQTLLHLAASFGLNDAIETLLGAPGGMELLDSKERLHHRPLHLSAIGGHASSTEALIAAGCDTSCSNLQGNTALHLACSKARWGVARLLLDRGNATASAHNKNKQTPVALALKQGFHIPGFLPELQPAAVGKTDNGVVTTHDDDHACHEKPISTNGDSKGSDNKPQEGGDSSTEKRDITADPLVEDGARAGGHSTLPRTALLHHPLCLKHFSCPPIRRSSDPPPENVKRLEVIYNEDSGVLRAGEFASLDWDGNPSRAQLADVLRVHDFSYVQKLERLCTNIPNRPNELKQLDGDTAVSHNSFEAAMRAAGAVCDAIDRVVSGRNRNAFCAVRPPGHHAGPRGLVTCGNDMHGSHGFCLLNNVAIGAAYARCVHRHTGIDKVAIIDFDVHHGNGTEEIVKALVPRVEEAKIHSPFCSGVLQKLLYSPWLNPEDPEKCLFVSVHGYGKKERGYSATGWFYPGSGETTCCSIPEPGKDGGQGVEGGNSSSVVGIDRDYGSKEEREAGVAHREPLVLDVGMPLPDSDDTPGASRHRWRDVYRNEILPKLAKFNPDLILVSAGFDAHKKDAINFGYIGLLEEDYEWITQQLVQVANRCCQGRMVSVLEGGYRIQGGIVSAFARSVAGHVRALVDGCESRQEWSAVDAASESEFEQRLLQERERKRKMRMEQQLQTLRDRETQLKVGVGVHQQLGNDHLLPSSKDSNNGVAHSVGHGVAIGEHGKEHPHGSAESAAGSSTEAAEREPKKGGKDGGESKPQGEKVEGTDSVPQQEGDGLLPSKRRRFNVDYVALQKKLQEEETAKKGQDEETTGTETMPVGEG